MRINIDIKIDESIDGYRVDLWDGEVIKKYNPETKTEAFAIVKRFIDLEGSTEEL